MHACPCILVHQPDQAHVAKIRPFLVTIQVYVVQIEIQIVLSFLAQSVNLFIDIGQSITRSGPQPMAHCTPLPVLL